MVGSQNIFADGLNIKEEIIIVESLTSMVINILQISTENRNKWNKKALLII